MEASKLYLPARIGGLELRNRLVMTPMHLAYCPDGEASDRLIEFYRARARGGVGLIVVGAVGIDPLRVNQHGMIQICDDRFVPGLRRLTDAVHAEGARIFPQLWHGGRYQRSREYGGQQAVAPSAVPSRFTGETPRALRTEEISELVSFFGEAARRARQAGFDGAEIAGSAGYMIAQFLSPFTNLRTDLYGGDLAGRMTFALEVVAAVRAGLGGLPVMVRVAGNDFMKGGNTNREAKQFCLALESAGVKAVSVTGGWHETLVPQLSMDVPPGAFTYLGRSIKSVLSIPVVVCNRMNPLLAERAVADGVADFVGMARPFVADPELANKAQRGDYGAIRPCVACNQGCMDNIFFGKSLSCLCNPEAGREADLLGAPARDGVPPRKTLVVGAGVSGLEYARASAERGNLVTIWERSAEPGGQVDLAGAPPGRRDFGRLKDYLVRACERLGVALEYGKDATTDEIEASVAAGHFDGVVLATGARPITVPIPIDEGSAVVQAWDVLRGRAETGSPVVVVGGGAVGVETALLLAEAGTIDADTLRFLMLHRAEEPETLYRLLTQGTKKVTIVEMAKTIGKDIGPSTRWSMMAQLRQFGVEVRTNARVLAVRGGAVWVEGSSGEERIEADTVVLAVGSRSNGELAAALSGRVPKLAVIGDAVTPRKMMDAIREAYDRALAD